MLVNVEKRPRLTGDFRRGGERLSESSWLLKERLRSALKLLSDQDSQLYSRLRTTNLIERAFPEVRRRTRPMGVMAHTQSLQRIVFAVFHHLNQNWLQQPLKFTHKS